MPHIARRITTGNLDSVTLQFHSHSVKEQIKKRRMFSTVFTCAFSNGFCSEEQNSFPSWIAGEGTIGSTHVELQASVSTEVSHIVIYTSYSTILADTLLIYMQ
jgi:hypothetical protein